MFLTTRLNIYDRMDLLHSKLLASHSSSFTEWSKHTGVAPSTTAKKISNEKETDLQLLKNGKMQIVDLELEKQVKLSHEIRTSKNNTKILSHSIEEILKKPSSQPVSPDKTEQRTVHTRSGSSQTKLKTKISQCTGM